MGTLLGLSRNTQHSSRWQRLGPVTLGPGGPMLRLRAWPVEAPCLLSPFAMVGEMVL